jgi:hypothetical protein
MTTSDMRKQLHRLIDEASDNQLDAVWEVLQPTSNLYTQEELNLLYKRLEQFEQSEAGGLSVEESHEAIRTKFKQRGV